MIVIVIRHDEVGLISYIDRWIVPFYSQEFRNASRGMKFSDSVLVLYFDVMFA